MPRLLPGFGPRVTGVLREGPAAIAPRREVVVLVSEVGHGIEAVTAPRVVAAEAREGEPAALPRPIRVDGLARIVRAGRALPTTRTDERRERDAIKRDGAEERRLGNAGDDTHL